MTVVRHFFLSFFLALPLSAAVIHTPDESASNLSESDALPSQPLSQVVDHTGATMDHHVFAAPDATEEVSSAPTADASGDVAAEAESPLTSTPVAIPEPTIAAILVAGVGLLLFRRRGALG